MKNLPCYLALAVLAPFGVAAQPPIRDFSLDVIEALGREIHRRDLAAAKATDIMFDQRLDLDNFPLRGWVVTEDSAGLLVTFVGEYDGESKAVFDVRPDETGERRFVLAEARALSAEEAAQFRARAVSENEITEPCADRYNSVVLEDPERDGWIVYWLAATTQPGTIVLGGRERDSVGRRGRQHSESRRVRATVTRRLTSNCSNSGTPSTKAYGSKEH